jgi:collagen type III alpha
MQRSDGDGNGKLSKEEVPDFLRERFDTIDTNKDDQLDKSELGVVVERMRRMREQGGATPGAPGRPGTPAAPGRPGAALNPNNRDRVANFLREHDKDIDGRVSEKEFGDGRADEFKKLDTDSDGFLSPDELALSK